MFLNNSGNQDSSIIVLNGVMTPHVLSGASILNVGKISVLTFTHDIVTLTAHHSPCLYTG